MNYLRIETALVEPVMQSLIDLANFRHKSKNNLDGLIYTLYNQSKTAIKLGFLNDKYLSKEMIEGDGYLIVASRKGSAREMQLLKSTLLELGFTPMNLLEDYNYSIELIKYLRILGWPTGGME